MKGFFTVKQTESKSRPDGKTYSCASCGLYRSAVSPRMKPFGGFKKGILNIGEAPGEIEDNRGRQWQGKTGRVLKVAYRRLGVDLFEDCLNINAVNCRPIKDGRNRTPTSYEVDCCRKRVLSVIDEYKPKVIVLLGGSALSCLIGYRWKKDLGGITKWRGWTIPDRDFNVWICPTFHPSYIERSEIEVETIWIQDLQRIITQVDKPLPEFQEPEVEVIEDLSILKSMNDNLVAIDYETTGLKPQARGHRIICIATAYNKNYCYVFMLPKTKKERKPFIDLLANEHVGKIAHSIKFEETWSVVRLKQPVQNWTWDSMLAAHLLDNRKGITSLKFQVYVNFGVVDYSSEIAPYLSSKGGGNDMNRIMELMSTPNGQSKLLEYCGLDAIYEYRLTLLQMKEFYDKPYNVSNEKN